MLSRHVTFVAALTLQFMIAGQASSEPRAIVELFTSQGCSSCPAADKLMGELSHDPTLVVLSLPVDYWDYLGWKDTLASHGHGKRQRAYAEARGDREVYTPQVVVNGVVQTLGSDHAAINNAIEKTRRNAAPLTLPVTMNVSGSVISINVPAGKEDQRGEIWLCPVTSKVEVNIGRGENRGRTIAYTNVVRRWLKLGDWTGHAARFDVPIAKLDSDNYALADIDKVAVVVQSGVAAKPGVMLGAATANLR